MKDSGISRPVDALGRIVIPAEMRRALGIGEGDRLSLSLDGGRIVLEKDGGDGIGDLRRACERLLCDPSIDADRAAALRRFARELDALSEEA